MIDFFPQTQHAELSPSSAYRWVNCTASVLLKREHNIKEPLAGDAAHIGTIAHKLAELVLDGENLEDIITRNTEQIDGLVGRFKFDLDLMLRNVEYFCHYVREQSRDATHVYVEQWLPIITDDTHGTADVIGYNASTRHCNIIDFKYGKVPVTVYKNYQMLLYAIGVLEHLHRDVEEFTLHIYQPNSLQKKTINVWGISTDDVKYYMRKFKEVVDVINRNEIYYTDDILICKYCMCKDVCTHYAN